MSIDIISTYLRPVAFIQSLLVAFYLLGLKKGNQRQNRLLSFLLFSICVLIGTSIIELESNISDIFTIFYILALDIRFIIGPLFYLYLKSVFKPDKKLKSTDLIHGSVFVLIIILQFFYKNFWLQPWKIFIIVDTAQIAVYILWSFVEFNLIRLFTDFDSFKLEIRFKRWLQFFIISQIITLIILISAWLMSFHLIELENWDYWIARLFAFTNFIFMNTIVYISLKIPDLFSAIKARNGELPAELQNEYRQKLIEYMENKKPYFNPMLSLNSLADELSISPKYLSQIINNSFQKNFYHYINSYRIEEVKKRLGNGNYSNILEIAYECGFNSKNTFNSAFKKITGLTPTEFRKREVSSQ